MARVPLAAGDGNGQWQRGGSRRHRERWVDDGGRGGSGGTQSSLERKAEAVAGEARDRKEEKEVKRRKKKWRRGGAGRQVAACRV